MDALRNPGTPSSRETSPEPNRPAPGGAPARRGPSPTPGAIEQPLLPRRARSSGMEDGPSSPRPRAAPSAFPVQQPSFLPNLHIERPGSLPQEEGPLSPESDLFPESPVSPYGSSQSSRAGEEDVGQLLIELGVPDDPRMADVDRIVDRLIQQPELASPFSGAVREMLANGRPQVPHGDYEFPISEEQLGLVATVINAYGLYHRQLDAERTPLQRDIDQQQSPLGDEIKAWVALTGEPIESANAFDDDDNAAPFARVLARLRGDDEPITQEAYDQALAQVSSVLHAIAGDAALRREVFSLAQDALGTCSDNLNEGFSKIVLAVDNHRMVRAVERGEVDAKRLGDWAGSLFRLSLLETEVNRYIDYKLDSATTSASELKKLTEEPLETMVHAKVALRESLGLPSGTVPTMQFRIYSVLKQTDLDLLEFRVQTKARKPEKLGKFLLGNPTWCAGMKALHPQEFQALKTRQDEDPFYDLELPPATDVAGQAAYAEKALQVQKHHAGEEQALLLRLAADGSGPQDTVAESSHGR